ncbi:hypothetical protein BDN71DRAFT_454529 [Pleurotus eryngii]|uniref:C2H2-type domain-containing protein n=1 Tax=Pleurotus eryngii TaxID=5323 RepID=A0A9P5ZLE9_PLEER|nr:hypothetical protein BDN71DRAFT_454529 [Pleurotus eryngii]
MVDCDRCNRWFNDNNAYDQHIRNSPLHFVCWDCNADFEDWDGLEGHYEVEHYYCSDCRKFFKDEYGLKEHYRQSPRHFYCPSCQKHFHNQNSLDNHLNSSTHRPKNVPCPMRGCGKLFISPAAVALHLEAGSCTLGMDRNKLDLLIQQYDKNHLITDPSRLITNGESSATRYYATERAYNEYLGLYECYLCDQTFRSLLGLNQHLGSARHRQEVYICRFASCGARFRALSGLCQHIESGSCGALQGTPYKRVTGNLMNSMKRLTM